MLDRHIFGSSRREMECIYPLARGVVVSAGLHTAVCEIFASTSLTFHQHNIIVVS